MIRRKDALRGNNGESILDLETREGLPENEKKLSSSLTAEMNEAPDEKV